MDLRDTGRERCLFEEALLIDLIANGFDCIGKFSLAAKSMNRGLWSPVSLHPNMWNDRPDPVPSR